MAPNIAFAANDNSPFIDVKETDWFANAVQYTYEKGMMNGTSDTIFAPNSPTTRGMIVTMLHRMESIPSATGETFTDVPSGQWYTDAVAWASANAIVNGYGNGQFGPDDPITREQMTAILYRYSQSKQYDMSASGNISDFSDANQISTYAADAMRWAIGAGLISGVGNSTLDPKGNATRAQIATIFMRYCENVAVVPSVDTPDKTFAVVFDKNDGGNQPDTKTVKEGEIIEQPTAPTRAGYTFNGWFTEKTGGTQFDFTSAITSDMTLYAHWSNNSGGGSGGGRHHNNSDTPGVPDTSNPNDIIYYCTVTFTSSTSDVSNLPGEQQVKSGESISEPSAPTRDGFTFDGWHTDKACTAAYNFTSPVTSNLTLYAKWNLDTSNTPEGGFAVTFHLNDNSNADVIYAVQNVASGDNAAEPDAPERDMYRFTGWYTEPQTAAVYDFNTPVTEPIDLYAGWGNPNGNDEGLYVASDDVGTDPSVTGIKRLGDSFSITVNTPKPGIVKLDFLNEDDFWNVEDNQVNNLTALKSIAAYTPDYCEMQAVSIPFASADGTNLPEHYALRATLLDASNKQPLCDPFYSIQCTTKYKEFDNITVADRIAEYGEDRIIIFDDDESNNNYGVFAEDIKMIETSDSVNVLTVAYEFSDDSLYPNTTYTFANPSAKVSALQVGDKVYALDKNGYPQLFKIGAAPTANADGSVVMTPDKDAILSDFYAVLKADMDEAAVDVQVRHMNAMGDIITPHDGIQPRLEIIDVNQTLSQSINYSINWKPKDWLTVTGSVGGKAELSIKLTWDAHFFDKDYFEASATVKVEPTLKASIKAEKSINPSEDNTKENNTKKVNAEWKAGKVSIPTNVPGLTLTLEASVPVEVKFSGTATISATATLTGGFNFNTTSGFHPIGKAELKSEVNVTAQAELKAGPKVAIGVAFLDNVVKADVSAQAGVKATISGSVGGQITTGTPNMAVPCA